MNAWFSKSLGDGMWADIPSEEIKQIFQPIFESAGSPAEMAVFTRNEEGGLHCEWVAYFSPAAAEVAKAVEAGPCKMPLREGLKLLAGDGRCWKALFEGNPTQHS
ncbi:MAG: hypothetical protein L6Q45_01470 [Anaerolineales bacterium]|nr:hypothetical protein [Anaerolineales bacterium]